MGFGKKNVSEKDIKSLSHKTIPFVPVQIFKELGGLLSSVNKKYINQCKDTTQQRVLLEDVLNVLFWQETSWQNVQ